MQLMAEVISQQSVLKSIHPRICTQQIIAIRSTSKGKSLSRRHRACSPEHTVHGRVKWSKFQARWSHCNVRFDQFTTRPRSHGLSRPEMELLGARYTPSVDCVTPIFFIPTLVFFLPFFPELTAQARAVPRRRATRCCSTDWLGV